MTPYELKLYNDLMNLCNTTEVFYYKDFIQDDIKYRIFSYRLATYSDFLADNALECRGHMFVLNEQNEVIRLAALPFQKFFNLNENEMTDERRLDLSSALGVWDKMDGSLMSTYLHNGELKLKSKTSLTSSHCISAMNWLSLEGNTKLHQFLTEMGRQRKTVNLEWTSPYYEHRIVIDYPTQQLTILGIRDMDTGEHLDLKPFNSIVGEYIVPSHHIENLKEFVESVQHMTDIEGFVISLPDGTYFKLKTKWYMLRHGAKFNLLSSPKRFFETIITDAIDDVKTLFHDDLRMSELIDNAVSGVSKTHNHIIATVDQFYHNNKELSRKDYAIKVFSELDKKVAGLAMMAYTNKVINYVDFAMKGDNFKELYHFHDYLTLTPEEE